MVMKRREEDNGDDGLPVADVEGLQLLQKIASPFQPMQIFTTLLNVMHVPDSNHVLGFWRSWNFWATASVIIHHQAEMLTSRWRYDCKHIHASGTTAS